MDIDSQESNKPTTNNAAITINTTDNTDTATTTTTINAKTPSPTTATATDHSQSRLVQLILQTLGVEDYEPKVITGLLDFARQYTANIFEDALVYSEHANKPDIDLQDIQLAIQERVNCSFTAPPSKEFLMEIAQERNKNTLPLIPEKYGVRLPSDKHCLTGINYSITPDVSLPLKSTGEKLSLDIDAPDSSQSHDVMKRRREEEDDEEEFQSI